MLLLCPKCHEKSKIPDKRVPSPGAWAKCPKCLKKFYIELLSPGAGAQGEPLMVKASIGGAAFNFSQVLVFPSPVASLGHISGAGVAFAAIILMTVFFLNPDDGRNNQPASQSIFNPYMQGPDQLSEDMTFLRKKTVNNRHLDYNVSYESPERRLFIFFLNHWKSNSCQEISQLNISSTEPERGLVLQASCQNSSQENPRIEISWEGAVVLVTGWEQQQFRLFK